MSAQNVEMVKGIIAGGDQIAPGDKQAYLDLLPGMVEQLCDPDIDWIEAPERVDSQTRHGLAGVLESWRNWLEGFEEYTTTPERFEDHGDRVLVVIREIGRGAASGVPTESVLYIVFTFNDDGKISRYEEFYDEDAARAAAEKS